MNRVMMAMGCWILLALFGIAIQSSTVLADDVGELSAVRQKLAMKQPVKIVCLGDSVTGIYYHTGGRRAYPEMLEIALRQVAPEAEISVINAGISGNSTIDALKRLQKDVLDHRPDVVTVMFGLNDMARVPKPDFQANLEQIIAQCRGVNAAVILCTPNGVINTSGRPIDKLLEYNNVLKEVGRQQRVPVSDVYAAYELLRQADPVAWRLLLSDEIHPNMDGHQQNAIEICKTITGKTAKLREIGPPLPTLPKIQARLKANESIRVLAMTPFDEMIGPAIKSIAPDAKIAVTPWVTADQTLQQLEQSASKIRATQPPYDLVVVAIPLAVTPSRSSPPEAAIRSYSWILNWSLSFGLQQWDVIGISPSVLNANLSAEERHQDDFARQMISAQDLNIIARDATEAATSQQIVEGWLRRSLLKP